MRKGFKTVGIIIVLALAVYGAYSLTKNVISFVKYEKQFSSIKHIENIKNGLASVPDIVFLSPDGREISLYSELHNKDFVIISFGSIYCDNCHKEYRTLESENLFSKVPENAEMFLAVPEERSFITEFEKDLGLHVPIYVIDENVPPQLGISKIPTLILVGKDKKIKMYHTGFSETVLEDMFKYIEDNG